MTTPLDGCCIVELGESVVSSTVGQFFSDFGAEVIKVETARGRPPHGAADGFAMRNRGKKSVMLESEPTPDSAVPTMVRSADVLIVADRRLLPAFGLEWKRLMADSPRLVVCETPAYAGPAPWAGGAESNGLLAASLGVSRRQSSFDGGPVEPVYPHLLNAQAVWATTCAVAALVERERSGFGQTVSVSGAQAALIVHAAALTVNPMLPDPDTAVGPAGKHPTYSRFVAGDGQWLVAGALGAKFSSSLLDLLGISDVLDDARVGGDIDRILTPENYPWVMDRVATAFRTRDRAAWLAMIAPRGIPCGPVDGAGGWLDHEQVSAIGMRAVVPDGEGGRTVMPGVPLHLCATPGRVRGRAPRPGEHTGAVTARPIGRAEGAPPMSPGPLFGTRVLNLGTFVAVPYAGMMLAELGATVTKVEPVTGDPFRAAGFVFNRGMRSVGIDLRAPAGRDVFLRLASHSDVMVDGMRPGVATALGIDYHAVSAVAREIIGVSLSAFGEGGPLSGRPGVDMVIQGMSGMMRAQGGEDEPVVDTIPITDVVGAEMLVLSVVLALYHRARTGCGQRAWTSLTGVAAFLQGADLVRDESAPNARDLPPRGGRDFRGRDAFRRYYETRDGWLRVEAVGRVPSAADLQAATILVDAEVYLADPAAALQASLRRLSTGEATARLEGAGVPSTAARRISKVVRDAQLLDTEFVHVREAADGTTFLAPGRYATFSRTPRSGPMISPGVGEHTQQLLAAAGYPPEAVRRLLEDGVVVAGEPMLQLVPPGYR